MRRGFLLVLLLAACSTQGSPRTSGACGVAALPHATAQQQAAVRSQARGYLSGMAGARPSKAVLRALLEVATSGATAPSDLPSAAASSLVVGGRAYGLPTLDEALAHLRRACR